jgi:hypothetical protein
MPHFRYTVVNKENNQLNGEIDAPSIDVAREELQELGFSIVAIEETKAAKVEAGVIFEFKGKDKENRTIKGTIKSEELYQAFKRLITEYELDVQYIVQSDLDQKEKAKQKTAGIKLLMKKYQEEVMKNTDKYHEKKFKKVDRNFDKQKALIMRQVDYVLAKVKESIEGFAKELNPEDKQKIKDYVNRILRLKNTTNLEYLKNTSRDLLKFLQNAEVFSKGKGRIKEKLHLYAETEDMIDHLDKGKDFGVYEDLEDQLLRWQSEHIKGKKKIPLLDRIKNLIFALIIHIIHKPEKIRKLNREMQFLSRELKQYYAVYLKTKDQTFRKEASESIKRLRIKRNKIKEKITKLQNEERKKLKEMGELNYFEKILQSVNELTGWLLFFYLAFYFVSGIILNKEILFNSYDIPSIFYLFQSGLIKYILPLIFLLHLTTSLKLLFFKKNLISNVVLFPVFAIFSLLVLFNF